jgi:hypothetical protein
LWHISIIIKIHVCFRFYFLLLIVTLLKINQVWFFIFYFCSAWLYFRTFFNLNNSFRLRILSDLIFKLFWWFLIKWLLSSWRLLSDLNFMFFHDI